MTERGTLPTRPWWLLHADGCPRFGKVTADATVCTCDAETRQAINQAFAAEIEQRPGTAWKDAVSRFAAPDEPGERE